MQEDRRCSRCGRALSRRAARWAMYCGVTCRVEAHRQRRDRMEEFSDFARKLRDELLRWIPPTAHFYALSIRPHPEQPALRFPNPTRRTLRKNGALKKSLGFSLQPWEAPMIPIEAVYQILLFDALGERIPTPPALARGLWIAEPASQVTLADGVAMDGVAIEKRPSTASS